MMEINKVSATSVTAFFTKTVLSMAIYQLKIFRQILLQLVVLLVEFFGNVEVIGSRFQE